MKRITKIAGVLMAMCAIGSAFASGKKDEKKDAQLGTLSYLNSSEEQVGRYYDGALQAYRLLEEKGYLHGVQQKKIKPNPSVRFYDTLDSLLMGLKSGEIWGIAGIPQSTASYICAKDSLLGMNMYFDYRKAREKDTFEFNALNRLREGFAFMMLEKNSALRDQFNAVIEEMRKDGSLSALIEEHIVKAMNGSELKLVQPERKEGRETIKVAVTGALPPMDYVASDGTFAGFNTALLTEIGKRLDKNITMVQVSSIGRATALASGTVDVVFWTRTSAFNQGNPIAMETEKFLAMREAARAKSTPAEISAMQALNVAYTGDKDGDARAAVMSKDKPDGTILTIPYFEDYPVVVGLKE